MKTKKPCTLVLVRNGNRLAGTAAQLAHISECGGWDAFLQQAAEATLRNFAQEYNAAIRKPRLVAAGGAGRDNGTV